MNSLSPSLTTLPGLGPKSAAWLAAAGITTEAQLRQLGAVEAYRAVAAQQPGVSLNLLWALFGALNNIHWSAVPPDIKAQLKAELSEAKAKK